MRKRRPVGTKGRKIITAEKLEEYLHNSSDEDGSLVRAVLFELVCKQSGAISRGIAVEIGENLSPIWQSGDVIVFWDNGDHTMLMGGEIKPETELRVMFWFSGDSPVYNILDRCVL